MKNDLIPLAIELEENFRPSVCYFGHKPSPLVIKTPIFFVLKDQSEEGIVVTTYYYKKKHIYKHRCHKKPPQKGGKNHYMPQSNKAK